MHTLEVFFDYICPFCLDGHTDLKALIQDYPQIQIEWCPCEVHPRPDSYGLHSDLCIQGLFFALDHGVDAWAYHEIMYRAAIQDRVDIEDADALCRCVGHLVDAGAFRRVLLDGTYAPRLHEANRYAFEQNGVWAVPSYRMDGHKLDSVENVGVTREQIRAFLDLSK